MEYSIVIVDVAPLLTLAESDRLDFLLATGNQTYISDWVIDSLQRGSQYIGHARALAFLNAHADGDMIQAIKTGVPAQVAKFEALGLDPEEASVNRVLRHLVTDSETQFALLLSDVSTISTMRFLLPDNVRLVDTRALMREIAVRDALDGD